MAYLLNHLLSGSATKYPDREAIVFKDDKMTYAELERESNKLANGLLGIGIERGEHCGFALITYPHKSLHMTNGGQ